MFYRFISWKYDYFRPGLVYTYYVSHKESIYTDLNKLYFIWNVFVHLIRNFSSGINLNWINLYSW